MGHGIAQVAAQSGFQVVAVETKQEALDAGMKRYGITYSILTSNIVFPLLHFRISGSLSKVIAKDVKTGKIKSEVEGQQKQKEVMERIYPSVHLADVKDCDVIVEAIIEIEQLKIDFYKNLGKLAKKDAIFASNTSSLPITNMAVASGRANQFVGLHFFNPVQIMKLVEVIRTEHTDMAIFQRMLDFGKELGKVPVSCKDTPGFIVNRLLVPYLAQAMAMVDRNDASIPDIDVSMQLGAGHPMGPLTLSDYVGLDTSLNILKGWRQAHPDNPAFIVPKCLEEKVAKGELGRKTGKGFYVWEGDKAVRPNV
ncbi:3-hydroxybutyryl-CoA dehydrogenase [archaeon]|nr:MAG: 3-hydroxybutyryl-CoA dehydrogenase [archaeon]